MNYREQLKLETLCSATEDFTDDLCSVIDDTVIAAEDIGDLLTAMPTPRKKTLLTDVERDRYITLLSEARKGARAILALANFADGINGKLEARVNRAVHQLDQC